MGTIKVKDGTEIYFDTVEKPVVIRSLTIGGGFDAIDAGSGDPLSVWERGLGQLRCDIVFKLHMRRPWAVVVRPTSPIL